MGFLTLTKAEVDQLTALNKEGINCVTPQLLEDGTWILNEDILTEIGPGKLFALHAPILQQAQGKQGAIKNIDRKTILLKSDRDELTAANAVAVDGDKP